MKLDLSQLVFSALVIRDSKKELKIHLNISIKARVQINKDFLAYKGETTREAKKAINIKVDLSRLCMNLRAIETEFRPFYPLVQLLITIDLVLTRLLITPP